MDGNGSQVQPDKVSMEVVTASGPVSYQFESIDAYTYRVALDVLSDPSISSAYMYASYNGYESNYYIIEPQKDQ